MSPRDTSMSSSKVTVTDIGENASSTGPSNVSIARTVERNRREHDHLVAGFEHAAAMVPA